MVTGRPEPWLTGSRFDDEDDVLGDVRGMVADSFEMARDENQIGPGLDRPGIAKHVRQQLTEDLILQTAQPIVLSEHVAGKTRVSRHKRFKCLVEHQKRQISHSRQIDQRFDRLVQEISLRRLADIHGKVSDALEIGVDLDRRHDGSQIDGNLLCSARSVKHRLSISICSSSMRESPAMTSSQCVVIAVHQGSHDHAQALFGQAAHRQQTALEFFELLGERPAGLIHSS